MGQLLDKAIEYSIKTGKLKSSEGNSVRLVIQQMATKYGFPEEWFVKTAMIEAEGFHASKIASNGCVGVFQVCPWSSVVANKGLKEVGGSLSALAKQSVVTQAKVWEQYHLKYWLNQAARKPNSAAEFYVINLFPAAYLQSAKGKLGVNTPIRTVAPRAWGPQAMILYSDYNSTTGKSARLDSGNSEVTLASIEKGLNLKTQSLLNETVINDVLSNVINAAGSLATNASQSVINGINSIGAGIKSALLTGQNCPPPAYTQQDRIIYPGCLSKSSNPIFGNSLGSGPSAPAINAIGTAGNKNIPTTGNSEPYSGELKPGGFIACMKKGTYTVTSGFGWRWGRMHKGIDLGAPIGVPVYAAADGVVTSTVSNCPQNGFKGSSCGGGYGNQILIKHQGSSTIYAHLSAILVSQGQQVKQGQLIGKIGNSGSSTGAHIHHEIRLDGKGAVDPTKFVNF